MVDIFDAVGLDKPNIGLLDEEFLAQVQNLPEKNLAVELLERLLQGEIKPSNHIQVRLGNIFKRHLGREVTYSELRELRLT